MGASLNSYSLGRHGDARESVAGSNLRYASQALEVPATLMEVIYEWPAVNKQRGEGMKTFNEWMNEGRKWEGFRFFNRRVVCADGYSISIQANNAAYCQPREDIEDVTGYDSFELGFPSESDKSILAYAEDEDQPVDTVYPYVPREIVERLIEAHGGIKEFASKVA